MFNVSGVSKIQRQIGFIMKWCLKERMLHWWACSSDTLVYPSIFTFPLLYLHCWSTTMHPHWHDHTQCNHTCLHLLALNTHLCFIRLALLISWIHVLQFTCFISVLSSPNVCPPMAWPITNPHTMWSGTYYSFTLEEPCVHFLAYQYLTCLYLPFAREGARHNCLYSGWQNCFNVARPWTILLITHEVKMIKSWKY